MPPKTPIKQVGSEAFPVQLHTAKHSEMHSLKSIAQEGIATSNSFLSPPHNGITQKHLMLVQSLLESAVAVGTLSIPEVSQILPSLQKVRPFQAGRNNMFVLWPK